MYKILKLNIIPIFSLFIFILNYKEIIDIINLLVKYSILLAFIIEYINYFFKLELKLFSSYINISKEKIIEFFLIFLILNLYKYITYILIIQLILFYFNIIKLIMDINYNFIFNKKKIYEIKKENYDKYPSSYIRNIYFLFFKVNELRSFNVVYLLLTNNTINFKSYLSIAYYRLLGIPYFIVNISKWITEIILKCLPFDNIIEKKKIALPFIFLYNLKECLSDYVPDNYGLMFIIFEKKKIKIINRNIILNNNHKKIIKELMLQMIEDQYKNPMKEYMIIHRGSGHASYSKSNMEDNPKKLTFNATFTSSEKIYHKNQKFETSKDLTDDKQRIVYSLTENALIRKAKEKEINFLLNIKNIADEINKKTMTNIRMIMELSEDNRVILVQTRQDKMISTLQDLRNKGSIDINTEKILNEDFHKFYRSFIMIAKLNYEGFINDSQAKHFLNIACDRYLSMSKEEKIELLADVLIEAEIWKYSKDELIETIKEN